MPNNNERVGKHAAHAANVGPRSSYNQNRNNARYRDDSGATVAMPTSGNSRSARSASASYAQGGTEPTSQMPPRGQNGNSRGRATSQDQQFGDAQNYAGQTEQFQTGQTRQFAGAPSGFQASSRTRNAQSQGYSRVEPVDLDGAAYGETASMEYRKMHRRRTRRVLLTILIVLVAIYLIGVAAFSRIFYPNTHMGTQDISLQPVSAVAQTASDLGSSYSVHVTGQGLDFNLTAQDLGINVDGNAVADEALHMASPWEWPVQIFRDHDVSTALSDGINANGLAQAVKTQVDLFNQTATDPVNATITYSSQVSSFVVQPEQAGTKLNSDAVLNAVDRSVNDMLPTATITDAELVQPAVLSTDSRLNNAVSQANQYIKADIKLTISNANVQVGEITPSTIAGWVTLDQNLTPTFNDDALAQWVSDFAGQVNTVGTTRTYTRPDGRQITVSGGSYGWEVDNDTLQSQIKDAITQGNNVTLDVPTTTAAYQYQGQGRQDFGRYVDVDLTQQHARAYDENGNQIWESDVVTGTPDEEHATPTGVWLLYNKESPSTLRGKINQQTGAPEYVTQVQYWMAFTDFGDGLHDATWQAAFGGTRYRDGYGSHGCINLPLQAAGALYNVINVGNAVVIHD